MRKVRTLGQWASESDSMACPGFFFGSHGVAESGRFLWGKPCLRETDLTESGIVTNVFPLVEERLIERPRVPDLYKPPLLLIRLQMDLHHDIWTKHFLAFQCEIFGVSGTSRPRSEIEAAARWLSESKQVLKALVAATSSRLFVRKATSCAAQDIRALPYPIDGTLRLSPHEHVLVADIVDYYRDLIRLGEDSAAMKERGDPALPAFNAIFTARINGVYKKNKLRALAPLVLPGVICQPYVFGKGEVDWDEAEELKGKLDALLRERRGGGLNVTRIARLYDGACIYLLKPDRLRYWLRSIALRDADETLADLAEQGF